MAFESLSNHYEFVIQDFPREWLPLTYLYDPDLPLFAIQYFHILNPKLLPGQRPSERDRLFGFIHHVNLIETNLSVSVVVNKDLGLSSFEHYKDALKEVVRSRLGLDNPVKFSDVHNAFKGVLAPANLLLQELWHKVISGSFGESLPFGRMWDPIFGLVRFVASWNSDGGRKGELIQTHAFASEFGEKIQTGSDVHVDFFLLPTFDEVTDLSNPLSNFPQFAKLAEASKRFVGLYCETLNFGNQSFSAFRMKLTNNGTKLNTTTLLKIFEKAGAEYQKVLFDNYSAFNRGPARGIIFLMMLHDLRQKLWNPETLTSADCGVLYRGLRGSYQTPKVITLYAQQCFGAEQVLPIDNWVETFLKWPFNFQTKTSSTYHADLFSCSEKWGKVERLIWLSAQARKVHSSVCKEILWCVRYGGREKEMRGANPLSCKLCEAHIRNVCPSYAMIANHQIQFNGSGLKASSYVFQLFSSQNEDKTPGQGFLRCESSSLKTKDIYSARDRPEQFKPYPQPGQKNLLTVNEFIKKY